MRKSGFFILSLLVICSAGAQQNYADTVRPDNKLVYAKHLYDANRGNQLPVYTGIQYFPYSSSIEGMPFFATAEWQKGSVVFEGILYENIFMKYELIKDRLIITPSETGGLQIALFSPRVKEFSFSGYKFIRLYKVKHGNVPEEGFYQELVSGKVTALARTKKVIDERVETSGIYRKFIQHARFYLVRDGKFYLIKNKGDLLNVLREKRNEIQQLFDKEDLNYRRNPEQCLTAATELYNKAN